LGKGSLEVLLLDVDRDGAVCMRVRRGPCTNSIVAHSREKGKGETENGEYRKRQREAER
jgi:hypothetical protein